MRQSIPNRSQKLEYLKCWKESNFRSLSAVFASDREILGQSKSDPARYNWFAKSFGKNRRYQSPDSVVKGLSIAMPDERIDYISHAVDQAAPRCLRPCFNGIWNSRAILSRVGSEIGIVETSRVPLAP